MSKENSEFVSMIIGILIGLPLAILVILTIMTPFADMVSTTQAYSRCKARGYETNETIVHYPFFWNVDNYCYGEGREDGVKL